MEINIKKILENAVIIDDEFPFYIDQLNSNDEMLTYVESNDEKYTFNEMNEDFFDYVHEKINETGMYIRLVHVIEKDKTSGLVNLDIEAGSVLKTINVKKEIPYEIMDYGIKIRNDNITIGLTVFDEKPHFSEIGEKDVLNSIICELIDDLIFYD